MRPRHLTLWLGLTAVACGGDGNAGIEVVPLTPTPANRQDVAVAVLSPQPGALVPNPVAVELVLAGFDLGVPTRGAERRGFRRVQGGQHLQLLVDDGPHRMVFDAAEPVLLGDLVPGPHLIRVIPVLEWLESVKGPGSFEAVQFFVERETSELPLRPGAPLLTYLQPVGTYAGAAADSIVLDFHVRNVDLGPGRYRVRLTIDGARVEDLRRMGPYALTGLAPGPHTIRLELRDGVGRVVPGPFKSAERTIVIEE